MITKRFTVSVQMPKCVTEQTTLTAHYVRKYEQAVFGSLSSRSHFGERLTEHVEFDDYCLAKRCETRLLRLHDYYHSKDPIDVRSRLLLQQA